MPEKIIMYGHPFCSMVERILLILNQSNVAYEYINIHQDTVARQQLRDINGGYESVPTLLFPDCSVLTEPSSGQLKSKLEEMGYKVSLKTMLIASTPNQVFIIFILFLLLKIVGVF